MGWAILGNVTAKLYRGKINNFNQTISQRRRKPLNQSVLDRLEAPGKLRDALKFPPEQQMED